MWRWLLWRTERSYKQLYVDWEIKKYQVCDMNWENKIKYGDEKSFGKRDKAYMHIIITLQIPWPSSHSHTKEFCEWIEGNGASSWVVDFHARQHITRPCHILTFQRQQQPEKNVSPICPLCTSHSLVIEEVREKAWRHRQAEHIKIYIILYIPCVAAFSHFLPSILSFSTHPRTSVFASRTRQNAKSEENCRSVMEWEGGKICVVRTRIMYINTVLDP